MTLWLFILFPTLGAIKHHPDGEIFSELIEAMLATSWREEQITSSKSPTRRTIEINSAALRDHIYFIPRVRSLRVVFARRVNLHLQTAVLEERGRTQSFRVCQMAERICDSQV